RRILQERYSHLAGGRNEPRYVEAQRALRRIAFGHEDETRRLRGLWTLHLTNGLQEQDLLKGLADTGPYVRAWTVQLALERGSPSPVLLSRLAELARTDPSPVVRLYLASGLQRMPPAQRWDVLEGLAAHAEDAADHNLPLMDWYAAEPLAGQDPARAIHLAIRSRVPLLP